MKRYVTCKLFVKAKCNVTQSDMLLMVKNRKAQVKGITFIKVLPGCQHPRASQFEGHN